MYIWFYNVLYGFIYGYTRLYMIGPSGNLTQRTGKIHHFQWEDPLQMVMLNSYIKFPEGNVFLAGKIKDKYLTDGGFPVLYLITRGL